jgi:hypothetical protein
MVTDKTGVLFEGERTLHRSIATTGQFENYTY